MSLQAGMYSGVGPAPGARLRARERATSCSNSFRSFMDSCPTKQDPRKHVSAGGGLYSGVGPARLERATSCSGGKRSIQLSYGPKRLGSNSNPVRLLVASSPTAQPLSSITID